MRNYNNIKSILQNKGIKQVWLAQQLGMSKHTVYKWCRNTSQPNIETLYIIAEILNVEVCDLLITLNEYNQTDNLTSNLNK